jgi:dihydrolipoamide dehydrogenase
VIDRHEEIVSAKDYDVVVIGSGVGGYTVAIRAGQLGLKTACSEGAPALGGTCLNVGCIPSKALLHASEMFDLARNKFAGLGIKLSPELHLQTMMKRKQASVDALEHGVGYLFRKYEVDRINGWGRFAGAHRVQVNKADSPADLLNARHIVITTGSIPVRATVPNLDAAKFAELAANAERNCPVSKVLTAEITLDAKLL